MGRYRGFTLIELVVVILIIGLLAAIAVPSYLGLVQQARVANLQALAGAMRSAAVITNSYWIAAGEPATPMLVGSLSIDIDNGYPDNTIGGIGEALRYAAATTGGNSLADDYDVNAGSFVLRASDGTALTNCQVTYTNAVDANTLPVITVVNSGC